MFPQPSFMFKNQGCLLPTLNLQLLFCSNICCCLVLNAAAVPSCSSTQSMTEVLLLVSHARVLSYAPGSMFQSPTPDSSAAASGPPPPRRCCLRYPSWQHVNEELSQPLVLLSDTINKRSSKASRRLDRDRIEAQESRNRSLRGAENRSLREAKSEA